MSRSIEQLAPYRVCELLDKCQPAALDIPEIATTLCVAKASVETIIRKLMREKTIFMAGPRKPDIGKERFTYSSKGDAVTRFIAYRNQVEKEKAAAHNEAQASVPTTAYIQAALNAHPLHMWRGTCQGISDEHP
jgi:transcription initiation factor IIE alpha subunit